MEHAVGVAGGHFRFWPRGAVEDAVREQVGQKLRKGASERTTGDHGSHSSRAGGNFFVCVAFNLPPCRQTR